MTISRTLIPTAFLLAGVAAAQPAAPPAPATPRAFLESQDAPPRPPRPARAPRAWTPAPDAPEVAAPVIAHPLLGDDFPEPPQPPRPALAPTPRAWVEAPEPPEPPQVAAPTPAPRAVPMPAMPPMPGMPGMPGDFFDQDRVFDLQEKAWKAAEKAMEMQDKFDYKFNFDFQDKFDIANATLKGLAGAPFAFAPQVSRGFGVGKGMSDDRAYDSGQRALEARRYTEALEYFNQIAARGGNRADGALYWKSYTLIKLGRADEARAALAELRKSYASSRWLDDAKALEVEAGKPVTPETESDEELKLIALGGLMQSDPDRAFPLVETLLKSAQTPKIKRQAVYVLAQNNSPKAQQLLEQVARGQGNPDLQLTAIRYLGQGRRQGSSNPVLGEIYGSSNDPNVKRAILNAFESARDKDRLLQIAKTEKDNDLRMSAIRLLGSIQGTQADMWSLYQAETNPEIKQRILEAMPSAGNSDKFLEIVRTEKDAKLRRFAIQQLGNTRVANTGDSLVSVYTAESDQDVKRSIISALGNQKNVKALVAVARSEKDNRMQQRILETLVNLHSPEANDYLMEVIKK